MADTKTTTASRTESTETWTDDERAAMKERAKELKAESRRKGKGGKADGEADLLAAIAAMPEPDRSLAERIHAIVSAAGPDLAPKTWYGMPAYARDGKVVCFFQAAAKFKARYATFGFNEDARLDDGTMWPTSWAITELTPEGEARIAALVKQAVG
jgi:uncharacterized protein YdhG (YjbR/CyaY superfamily)